MVRAMGAPRTAPLRRRTMGALDLFLAFSLMLLVWMAAPVRWWPVDIGFTALALGFTVAGVGLWVGARWAEAVAKVLATITLLVGIVLCTALAFTAASLAGLYGPVGMGGSIILTVAAFLVLPYFIVFPAAQIYSLLPSGPRPAPHIEHVETTDTSAPSTALEPTGVATKIENAVQGSAGAIPEEDPDGIGSPTADADHERT